MSLSNVKIVPSISHHGRRGDISNDFTYKVDYVLIPVHEPIKLGKSGLKHNKFGLLSFHDKDHGGTLSISEFAQQIMDSENLRPICDGEIWLYTQPRFLGYAFNPVSLWFFFDKTGNLRAVLAEVSNRAKGKHFYICRHEDFRPIGRKDKIKVKKIFHVSPFQETEGDYEFRFQYDGKTIGAWIDYSHNDQGLFATLCGHIQPMTNARLYKGVLARPLGAFRVVSLIYWQALKLKIKGAKFRLAPLHDRNTKDKKRISR